MNFRSVRKILILEAFSDTISENDLVSQQRFRLFKITTIFSLIAYIALFYQACIVLTGEGLVKGIISFLFLLLFANYFGLLFHKKQRFAYMSLVLLLFTLLHVVSYYEGGVRNSGVFYFAGLILAGYMLIGNKGGKILAALSVMHIVYFYIIDQYTNWTSYDLIGTEPNLIDLDFLMTGVVAVLVLTSQSDYIEKSKNAIIADINSKKDELAVKNTELKKLSMVASKANNGVTITDMNGIAEWVNDGFTRMTGYTFAEIVGKNPDEIIVTDEISHDTKAQLKQNLLSKESYTEELLKYKKDGTKIWIQASVTPILDQQQNITKYILIESDITARKTAEEKMAEYLVNLEKTNKELDKFAYIVSHDLKAPLRAIGNLTGWIEEDIGATLPPASIQNFKIIKGRVIRMEALINGILDYSKAGKNKGQFVSFDTRILLKETFDLIGPPDNCKIDVNHKLPILHTDKIKLQQVFMNLVNNAIKYNDKGEIKIQVSAEEEKGFWHFKVTDNGPGIEKQYHDKIFVIFQTLNARDEVESTGVGLAIVKKIIEDQGGQIWVDSEKGQGAAFHFTWSKSNNKNSEDIAKAEFVPV
ncbi:MAG: ATP-binding protein [Bacteroidia bacterium]